MNKFNKEQKLVILGSSLGTLFEWYDFFLYGALAVIIAKQFFAGTDPNTAFIFALLAFATGFIVRPFGALLFGRLGDMIGRKYTFLATIIIMGLATFLVGVLPTYAQAGIISPIALISLRILQGLALGGEYGGAAIYMAEHSPPNQRGYFTSWLQSTSTLGFILSLLVILLTRIYLGEEQFADWGWRIPFLLSIILLGISLWIRLALNESPIFLKMKNAGKISKSPILESFSKWNNLKIVLLALAISAGQAVVWYTGEFYALFFLTQTLKVDSVIATILVGVALLLGTPFFIIFGYLSDKIGRNKIIVTGFLLAVLTYFPLFKALTHYANPKLEAAINSAPVVVIADPNDCQFQFNPTGTKSFTSSCDIVKASLARRSVNYTNANAPAGTTASIKVGDKVIQSYDAKKVADPKASAADFAAKFNETINAAGYPTKADPEEMNYLMIIAILFTLVIYVTMTYAPIAALLVEMFPTRIRYTSLSLPYHIGNGWFGGLLPTTAFAMVALKGDVYYGLWYVIFITIAAATISLLFVKDRRNVDLSK